MVTNIHTASGYTVSGVSVGGVYTSIVIPQLHIAFDCGIPLRAHAGVRHLFFTHTHADHIGGLVAMLGIRDLVSAPPLDIYVPMGAKEDVDGMLAHARRMCRQHATYEVRELPPGDGVVLGHGVVVMAFATHHTIPSLGYTISRTKMKLRPEFLDLPGEEIARRRKAGDEIFDCVHVRELTFITDTTKEVYETNPSILESTTLIAESTAIAEQSRDGVRAWGHMHALDTLEQDFKGKDIVLMHFSARYSDQEILDYLAPYPHVTPILPG